MNDRAPQAQTFRLEEATIEDLHAAIRSGETAVVAVVQHYLARIRAYNGVASLLVTDDGAPVAEAKGAVRAGSAASVSDRDGQGLDHPAGSRQVPGPAAGIRPHGGDRLRSRRAAAVRHDRRHPERRPAQRARHAQHPRRALGDLPRRVRPAPVEGSAAARRAAGLRSSSAISRMRSSAPPNSTPHTAAIPTLEAMPMYGVVFAFKDPFDTKDMRSTGGGDARYDIDFPARDHVLVEQLRNKGAIIFAKAVNTEYNGRAGDPGGRNKPEQGAAVDARLSAQLLGAATRRTSTTRHARRRSAQARVRAYRSAPIS